MNINSRIARANFTGYASGAVASFTGLREAPVKIRSYINAIQEGTGDPSPDNIRPIIGVSECNVTRCGKNLFDGSLENGSFNTGTGEKIVSTTRVRSVNDIPLPSGSYVLNNLNGWQFVLYVYDLEGNFKSSESYISWKGNPLSFSLVANRKINFAIKNNTNTTIVPSDVQGLILYDTAVASTYTIQFGDTYYGGSLDVTNGLLTVADKGKYLKDLTWSNNSSYSDVFNGTGFTDRKQAINGGSTSLSSHFAWKTSSNLRDSDNTIALGIAQSGTVENRTIVYVHPDSTIATTKEEFEAWCETSNAMIVCPLATPVTVQLTPTQVEQLLGANNIFADCGNVEVYYVTI